MMDFSCFIGTWPFHKVRNPRIEDLIKLHKENNIKSGFVSSLNSVFYNDPWESEVELSAKIADYPTYHHVMTVNPALPGTADDLKRALTAFRVRGIRIYPGFHGYSLSDECMEPVLSFLKDQKLPLFITFRMEDERVTHMFHPKSLNAQEADEFIKSTFGFPIVLSNIRDHELVGIKDTVLLRNDVFSDTCGFKSYLFYLEDICETGLTEHIVFGSLSPIFCLKSTLLVVETAEIPEEEKKKILSGERLWTDIKA